MVKITGIILAGGKSSRMGQDKGLLELYGKPLIEYSIEALVPLCSEIIIIANSDEYKQFGLPVYSDIYTDKGPLGGIYTGLKNSNSQTNIILSCDTPLITSEYLKWLISKHSTSITFSRWEDRVHPLASIFDRSTIDSIKNLIEKDQLKMTSLQTREEVQLVNAEENPIFEERIFTNVNTQTELNQLINKES